MLILFGVLVLISIGILLIIVSYILENMRE